MKIFTVVVELFHAVRQIQDGETVKAKLIVAAGRVRMEPTVSS
jgi:hypothetical protein